MADERARWLALVERADELRREAWQVDARTAGAIDAYKAKIDSANLAKDEVERARLLAAASPLLSAYTKAWNDREAADAAFVKAQAEADAAIPESVRLETERLAFDGKLELARRAGRAPPGDGSGRPQ